MTRVDFYRIQGGLDSAIALAGKLALEAERDALVYSTDAGALATLAELLAQSVPTTADSDPLALTICSDGDPGRHHGLLINLDVIAPPWFSRFHRLAEIVHDDPVVRAGKRERYRFYRDRGYPLYHQDLNTRDLDGTINDAIAAPTTAR